MAVAKVSVQVLSPEMNLVYTQDYIHIVGLHTHSRTTASVRHVGGLHTESGALALGCVSRSVVSDSLQPHGLQPPCSSVLRTLQARILDWVAISFFKGSSQPRDQSRVSYLAGRFFTVWATRETPISGFPFSLSSFRIYFELCHFISQVNKTWCFYLGLRHPAWPWLKPGSATSWKNGNS